MKDVTGGRFADSGAVLHALVPPHASGASFSTSSYSSILQLLYACAPFKMTSKLPRKDIELSFTVCYSIKNPFLTNAFTSKCPDRDSPEASLKDDVFL